MSSGITYVTGAAYYDNLWAWFKIFDGAVAISFAFDNLEDEDIDNYYKQVNNKFIIFIFRSIIVIDFLIGILSEKSIN